MKPPNRRNIDELMTALQAGVKAVFESDAYIAWLTALAHFRHYSLNNTLLIAMQRPDAEQVASIRTWNQLGRKVKAGEHGIRILVPIPVKIKRKSDDDTEDERIKLRFKVGHVFDIGQTEGDPLPELGVLELSGNVDGYDRFLVAATAIAPVPVRFDDIKGSAKGYYDPAKEEIVIRNGMSERQTGKTLLHEICHASIHSREHLAVTGEKDRMTKEVEAESVAYVCMRALLGEDSSDYSFGYIAGWSGGKELPELRASLQTIHDTASELIDAIEAIIKENSYECSCRSS